MTEKKDTVEEIVNSIIEIPVKNLEKRVKEIENEINTRDKILDKSLSNLGTRQLELEQHLRIMKYALGSELNRKFMIENNLAKIKFGKIDEILNHFRDVSKLRDRLQTAREELVMEREKRRLVV